MSASWRTRFDATGKGRLRFTAHRSDWLYLHSRNLLDFLCWEVIMVVDSVDHVFRRRAAWKLKNCLPSHVSESCKTWKVVFLLHECLYGCNPPHAGNKFVASNWILADIRRHIRPAFCFNSLFFLPTFGVFLWQTEPSWPLLVPLFAPAILKVPHRTHRYAVRIRIWRLGGTYRSVRTTVQNE